ncbi:MAG: tyrosine-protein phosphatase [Promethearchaeota archaeon]
MLKINPELIENFEDMVKQQIFKILNDNHAGALNNENDKDICEVLGGILNDLGLNSLNALVSNENYTQVIRNHENHRNTEPDNYIHIKLRLIISQILILFKCASEANYRGDSYNFFMLFVKALHKSIGLYNLINEKEDWESPQNPIKSIENDFERKFIKSLFPQVSQENANFIKGNYIEWMLAIFEELLDKYGVEIIPTRDLNNLRDYFLKIYKRHYLRNVRPVVGVKGVFRSPHPNEFLYDEEIFKEFLTKNNIKLVIDLRGPVEDAIKPVNRDFFKNLGIKVMLFDLNERGSERSYTAKLKTLKKEIHGIFTAIAECQNNEGVLIHCESGKDRTGIIAALLQMLSRVDRNIIIEDYAKTGHDAIPIKIEYVLKYIDEQGGIVEYLRKCAISESVIERLKLRSQKYLKNKA